MLATINDTYAVNTYCKKQCVEYVRSKLPENSKMRRYRYRAAKNWWHKIQDNERKSQFPIAKSIIVFDGWPNNRYGHVGIVTKVRNDSILVNHSNWHQTKSKNCIVSSDWFTLSIDPESGIKAHKNNKIYPVKGFVYAWELPPLMTSSSYGNINIGDNVLSIGRILNEKVPTGLVRNDCWSIYFKHYPNVLFGTEYGAIVKGETHGTRMDYEPHKDQMRIKYIPQGYRTPLGYLYIGMKISELLNIFPKPEIRIRYEPALYKEYYFEDPTKTYGIKITEWEISVNDYNENNMVFSGVVDKISFGSLDALAYTDCF